jgi:hypothetical protein
LPQEQVFHETHDFLVHQEGLAFPSVDSR